MPSNADSFSVSPQDVILAGRWNAALFTSYALSLSFFESAPLIALRRTGCRSIALLADKEGYRVSISEAGVTQVGRTYELAPVCVDEGIFHPKMMVLLGPDGPRAAIGSGNLTFNGWGGNLEMLDYIAPKNAPQAFADLADFLLALQTTDRVHAEWPDLSQFVEACQRAGEQAGDRGTRVINSLQRSIAEQLVSEAERLGGALSLTVASPFFGSSIAAVQSLADKLNAEEVAVLTPVKTPEQFPFVQADAVNFKIKPVTAPLFSEDARKLHSKLIEVVCRRGCVCLSGSTNATSPALSNVQNVEVGILRILPAADRVRWKPIKRPKDRGVGGAIPAHSTNPVLVANFDGSSITGQVFGLSYSAGQWRASLQGNLRERKIKQPIAVNAGGTFEFQPGELAHDLWSGRSAFQLTLRNDLRSVVGWIMISPHLQAIRERGPIAEAVIRIVSGSEDHSDIEVILNFFAQNPEALITGAHRGPQAKSFSKGAETTGTVDVQALKPISRTEAKQTGDSGAAELSAFELLLERLREYVSSHPAPERDTEDEEIEEESRETKSQKSAPKRPRKIPHEDFYRLVDAFIEHIEALSEDGVARRAALLTLLDLGLFFSARAEDAYSLRTQFPHRWAQLALRLTRASAPPDELEQSLVLVLLFGMISGIDQPQGVHAQLQRRVGGIIPGEWAKGLAPGLRTRRAVALIPGSGPEAWAGTLARALSSRTPWMDALEAWEAMGSGQEIPKTNALLLEAEGDVMCAIARGEINRDCILPADGKIPKPFCPRCHRTLPSIQASRIRSKHIASAVNCCHRILIDLSP
jgi:hypothetical protein